MLNVFVQQKGKTGQNSFQVSDNLGIPGIFGCGMAGSKGTIMHVEWMMPVAQIQYVQGEEGWPGKTRKLLRAGEILPNFFLGWDLENFSCPNFFFFFLPCRLFLKCYRCTSEVLFFFSQGLKKVL